MNRALLFVLGVTMILGAPIGSFAQTDPPQMSMAELQAMVTAQQQRLDQQAEILRSQTEALRQMKTRLDQMSMAAGAAAPEMSKDELAFRERLARVEKQLAESPEAPADVLRAGDFPGSIRIPGSPMAAKVGGFVRMGMVENLAAIGSEDRFVVATIPIGEEDVSGFAEGFNISAKRSRVNLDMRMDSSVGQFRAYVEGDFAGQGGSDNYRLRHAFGQYNRFILGQTWSTLVDRAAEPEELDFEGLNAQISVRQPIFRWTKGLGGSRPFALGLENPSPAITGGTGISSSPDVVVHVGRHREWGHLRMGLVLRQLTGELDDPELELQDSTFGWGLTGSGSVKISRIDPRDNLKFQVNLGRGLGRYLIDLASAGGKDAIFDPENQLRSFPVFSGYLALQHWWKQNPWDLFRDLRSTFTFGYLQLDNFDFEPDDAYRKTLRSSMNLIWSPISQIDIGIEYLWGRKWAKDGSSSTASQIQGVATFKF